MERGIFATSALAFATALASCASHGHDAANGALPDASPAIPAVDAAATPGDAAADDGSTAGAHVLVFSRTLGFRHDSIPDAIAAIQSLGAARGWIVTATEDAAALVAALPTTNVVVFALTTGDVLDDGQQTAFEAYARAGGGFVGLHSATDTEYDWPFYQALVGATFLGHPPGTPTATLHVTDRSHPASAALPDPWTRADEYYSFRANPSANPSLHVLVTVDESTYSPDAPLAMGAVHPMVWWQTYEGARSFYSALGHSSDSYADPVYKELLAQAIAWAVKR